MKYMEETIKKVSWVHFYLNQDWAQWHGFKLWKVRIWLLIEKMNDHQWLVCCIHSNSNSEDNKDCLKPLPFYQRQDVFFYILLPNVKDLESYAPFLNEVTCAQLTVTWLHLNVCKDFTMSSKQNIQDYLMSLWHKCHQRQMITTISDLIADLGFSAP